MRMLAAITSQNPFQGWFAGYSFVVLGTANGESTDDVEEGIITNEHFNVGIVNSVPQFEFIQHLKDTGRLSRWEKYILPSIGEGLKEFLKQEVIYPKDQALRFEVFGCDILLDEDLHPWFLECNRCAGITWFMRYRFIVFQELVYILLHSLFLSFEVPLIRYWIPL